ncbi:MAG: beta-N-acetylhexosaminidase [Gammaproteobacteria bacterium]
MPQTFGPIILDLLEPELNAQEKEILEHPLVGGVILFTRNYENPQQIKYLCKSIRQTRSTPLLIAVDQEGGKVQRFREGFTRLPPMGEIGDLYDKDPAQARHYAEQCGWQMASELLAVGVDLSFAPVLDLNRGRNPATDHGRPFHRQPDIVIELAKALIGGMHKAGMAATGKHFPGHGAVTVDTHVAMPVDERDFATIAQEDLVPFVELIKHQIDAIMPAHILFPAIDDKPAVFSERWLKDILRNQFNFTGVIFSDDLNMGGAQSAGNYAQRAQAALNAGCDMALICNNRDAAITILDQLPRHYFVEVEKFNKVRGKIS